MFITLLISCLIYFKNKNKANALQFGGWATGRQPLTVKSYLLGNQNCGLRMVRPSGIDLSSGKGLMR